MVTDPPYNVNYEGTAGKIKNDNLADEKFYQFLFDAFSNIEKVMADDASIYVFHADTEGLNFRKAFSDAGFYLSGCCIWKKPTPGAWTLTVSVAARALSVRMEEKRQAPVVRRPQADHDMGVRENQEEHGSSDNEADTAPGVSDTEFFHEQHASSSIRSAAAAVRSLLVSRPTGICYTIELDEKYCDVIVKRYIEQVGSADSVSVERDGKTYTFAELEVSDE